MTTTEEQRNDTRQNIEKFRYNESLNRPEWRRKRREILERDGYRCRHCKSTTDLQVHHRQYHVHKATGRWKLAWEYANKYLITLCDDCHCRGHFLYAIPQYEVDF